MPRNVLTPNDAKWAQVVSGVSRREFVIGGGAMLGLFAVLGGRASASSPTDSSDVSFEYEGFSASIPRNPQRVLVADSRVGLDFALLAGYPLVAASNDPDSHLTPLVPADTEVLYDYGTETNPNIEAIAAFAPDLIIMGRGWWDYYDGEGIDLGAIAPILAVNEGRPTPSNWRQALIDQLTLLDRTDQLDGALRSYDDTITETKERIGDRFDGKIIGIGGGLTEMAWLQVDTFCTSVAKDLGLTVLNDPNREPAANGSIADYSLEQLDVFAPADLLILQNLELAEEGGPAWQTVPAIREGRAVTLHHAHVTGSVNTANAFARAIGDAIEGLPQD